MTTNIGTLRLDRFCGHELYPVVRTDTYVAHPSGLDKPVLNLELWCGPASERTVPDEEFLDIEPSCEIWVPVREASWSALIGTKEHVEWSYHEGYDAMNRLYCAEHEKMWSIHVAFLETQGTKAKVIWRATAHDPNHYSGGKPVTKVSVEAWFELEAKRPS